MRGGSKRTTNYLADGAMEFSLELNCNFYFDSCNYESLPQVLLDLLTKDMQGVLVLVCNPL